MNKEVRTRFLKSIASSPEWVGLKDYLNEKIDKLNNVRELKGKNIEAKVEGRQDAIKIFEEIIKEFEDLKNPDINTEQNPYE